ncbi:hypothetical protein V8D89_004377 [Ganoderma adspersum]
MLELLRIKLKRDTVSTLLSLLTFPPSTRVDIGIAVVTLVDSVTIASGPTSTIREPAGGSARLRVTAKLDQWTPYHVNRIFRLLRRAGAPVSRLLLAQHPAQRMPSACDGRAVFPRFLHLTDLALHGRSSVCNELIRALRPPPPPASSEPAPLPLFKDPTVGVATKLGSQSPDQQPNNGIFVAIHFRECCRLLRGFPSARSERGCRKLSRLEVFSYEKGCMGKPDSAVSHVDLAALVPGLVEHELEPLRRLVDGLVVFSGYRFFTDA